MTTETVRVETSLLGRKERTPTPTFTFMKSKAQHKGQSEAEMVHDDRKFHQPTTQGE